MIRSRSAASLRTPMVPLQPLVLAWSPQRVLGETEMSRPKRKATGQPAPQPGLRGCTSNRATVLAAAGFHLASGAAAGFLLVARSCGRRGTGGGRRWAVSLQARGGEDYYETLGVGRSASDSQIKSAFRRLAKQYHPDINKEAGAQEQFRRYATCYEVLSDPQKRRCYDQFGEAGVQGMSGAGPDLSQINLEDLLGSAFGSYFARNDLGGVGDMGSRRHQNPAGPHRGTDLKCEVEIPFETACFGGQRHLPLRREETCKSCSGGGFEGGGECAQCRRCGGSGVAQVVVQTPLGIVQTAQACPACGGGGVDPSCLCQACRGKGTRPEVVDVSVKVPPGCNNGSQLRVKSAGDKGSKGGQAGDLYISVKVTPPEKAFRREGCDIHTENAISMYDAMLGNSILVRTIDGTTEVEVPAGTQPGTRMRIRGRGVPKLGEPGIRGDHYVNITVEVPRHLTAEQESIVQELQANRGCA